LAAQEWGVLDLDELRSCGLSANAIATRRRRGQLHLVHRGVYAVGHAGLTIKGRLLAAVKACGRRATASFFSAGAMWSVIPWDEERPPDVTVPGRGTRLVPGVNVHRTRTGLHVIRFDGIPVTSPARTLVDLSSVLPFKPLRRAVREAMALKRVTVAELTGVRSKTLNQILADGYVPTRTELEDAVLDLVIGGGLKPPHVNTPISVNGRPITPDFRWPEQRLVIEADSRTWHDHRLAREDDAERQAALEAHGERVLRVTWAQAIARPAETLRRIRNAGAPVG
jgi:very-short-patch-repair endonuclease